eukprot:9134080-Pyramimonas_sp.AAC.1
MPGKNEINPERSVVIFSVQRVRNAPPPEGGGGYVVNEREIDLPPGAGAPLPLGPASFERLLGVRGYNCQTHALKPRC